MATPRTPSGHSHQDMQLRSANIRNTPSGQGLPPGHSHYYLGPSVPTSKGYNTPVTPPVPVTHHPVTPSEPPLITPTAVAAAAFAAAVVALVPPLLLGGGVFWFIAPPLGILAGLAILFSRKVLLGIAAGLVVAGIGMGVLLQPLKLSPQQQRKLAATGYFLDAQTSFAKGQYADALTSYEQSKVYGLNPVVIAYQSSQCCLRLGYYEDAAGLLSEVLSMPYALPAETKEVDYAYALSLGESYEESNKAFQEAVKANRNPGFSYFVMGTNFERLDEPGKSEEMFLKAHRLWYNPSKCSMKLGKLAEARREYERAEKLYRRALRENPENLSAYAYLANLLFSTRRGEESRQTLRKGLEVSRWVGQYAEPADAATLLNGAGYVYARAGNLGYAEIFFQGAIERSNTFMEPYLNLAQAYIRQNRPLEAQFVLQRALKVNPSFEPAHQMLARLNAQPAGNPGTR